MAENQQQMVGDYILGQLLGEGTTGKVKLAMHKETGQQVAIKIIKKSMFDVKPDLQRKIRREIALMRLLDHPHIMKLIGICESARHLYIILEFEKHGELFDYLVSRRRLSADVALNFFRQLIYGLEYLHAHAICHRDLKPENILLDEFDHVKIADFGFARWMRAGIADTSCGSPHYAAPEVVRGLRYDGRAADIWSCGVILYALLAYQTNPQGKLPFDDPSIRNLLAKVKAGRYVMPSLPFEIQDLISRMLTVTVQDRITMDELKEHPAFRLGLPEAYSVPRPLPVPISINPISPDRVNDTLINILRSIGYNSDDEIEMELTSDDHSMAKIFYLMYNRLESMNSIPWTDSGEGFNRNVEDDLFMMTPRAIPMISPVGQDQFGRRRIPQEVSTPGSMVQSLATNVSWGSVEDEPNLHDDETFTIAGITLEQLVTGIQVYLQSEQIEYFYPNDCLLILKRTEMALIVTITFDFREDGIIEAYFSKIEGSSEDFNYFSTVEIAKVIESTVEQYQNNAN